MRVERDAVRPLDSPQLALGPPRTARTGRHRRRRRGARRRALAQTSAISASGSTEPVSMVPAEATTSHGPDALREIPLDRSLQRGDRHPAVDRRWRPAACGARASPGDMQRLVDAMMGEAGHVDRAAAVRVTRLRARRRSPSDWPGCRPRSACPRCVRRIADHLGEPGGAGIFQPDRAGAGRGEARIFVRDRGEEIAERRMEQAAARNIGHEAWARWW